ncbi:MAG: carboxylating nicotinate-nucleotide diphosphorylase [bacterium]|nr:carboxylating nicotinate-nucleotide diphosphorylase [bacterium]
MITEQMEIIRLALDEDLAGGVDVTTDWLVGPDVKGEAWIEAREDAIVSGLDIVRNVFLAVDNDLMVTPLCEDGARVRPLNRVISVYGHANAILKAERTALNFLTHLSGVATKTSELVELTRAYGTKIWCTRKTTPGLRRLEVAAVRAGGGDTYRDNLYEKILVKDNHLGVMGGMDVLAKKVEHDPAAMLNLEAGKVEVASLYELELAVKMGWRQILLDNFAPEQVREAVERYSKVVGLEASGGITTTNIRDYAATGIEAISIGQLTHSVRSVDFALEVDWSVN